MSAAARLITGRATQNEVGGPAAAAACNGLEVINVIPLKGSIAPKATASLKRVEGEHDALREPPFGASPAGRLPAPRSPAACKALKALRFLHALAVALSRLREPTGGHVTSLLTVELRARSLVIPPPRAHTLAVAAVAVQAIGRVAITSKHLGRTLGCATRATLRGWDFWATRRIARSRAPRGCGIAALAVEGAAVG